jgi:hypothetical protein
MTTLIPTFDSFVDDASLDVLNPEQKRELLQTVHSFMASAGRIAVSHDYLVVEGGNLDYYAGLEYSSGRLKFQTPHFKVWRIRGVDPSECNAASLALRARNLVDGRPIMDEHD